MTGTACAATSAAEAPDTIMPWMSTPDTPPSTARRWLLGLVLAGTALSPLHTKLAGAAWLAACALALPFGFTAAARPSGVATAARAWLCACLVAVSLWLGLSWFWNEPCCTLTADQNAGLRLLLAAFATWVVARHASPPPPWQRWTGAAVAAACLLGAGLALVEDRNFLPSHPIPWAVAMSFLVCLLLPRALDPREERRARWAWALGAACGIGAVLASQSRGAFGILAWAVVLAGLAVKRRRGHLRTPHLLAALLLLATLLGAAISLPSDPLRARKAWHEVSYAIDTADYNSSLGARVYLFRTAWQGIQESPWIGLGPTELLRRIRHAGEQLPPDQRARLEHVRQLGHAHNQYLNDTMEGGLLGLGALLALIAGMAVAAVRLGRINPVAGQQMAGLLVMHATAGLSNVNLMHTYYVVMLSLCIVLVFLHAGEAPATRHSP